MKYFRFGWLLLLAFLVLCSGDAFAAPKPKGRAKPKIRIPKININIHHNNIHIG
ncbi:uncharacterized protein LOC113566414 [Drosophila persimilis]|uniref:Uncharacterized protein n=1 Tax=Drosophila pseudoobscura pseudoobscura TaxID=46245 RepID=A0A6I8VDI7_DROPS|nr:uncharacterized protein LOC26533669 [Drosophila pseudoobscura]XP_026847683.1 uncharacterized protein LOC113566414 [Drosophila persimilis]